MTINNFYDLKAIARGALLEYGFYPQIPQRVLKEAQEMHADFYPKLEPGIKDLTALLWSSIDNDDSRDLDQIEFCELLSDGDVRVRVAISDVDHHVKQGTYCDLHASKNAVTVYTGIEIFHMLPERLCTDLTSLVPNEDRLAIVMDFIVDQNGLVKSPEVYRAIVRNRAQLIYEIVGDWFEGKTPKPDSVKNIHGLEDQLLLQLSVMRRLKEARRKNGALEFESIETKPKYVDNTVKEIVVRQRNAAHQLIENFMIAANGVMVNFLRSKKSPVIARVVKTPEKWESICEIAEELGQRLPKRPQSKALSTFLERQAQKDPEHFPDLSLSVIKLLGQGEYDVIYPGHTGEGHFGLAVHDYTHSTAPNRRYIDLIMQRLLKAALRKSPVPYSPSELTYMAGWSTDRDQYAKKVERFMRKVASAMLLLNRVGEVFEGYITGASDKGTYVRLIDPPGEGRVVRRFEGMDLKERVAVRLIKVSPEKGHIDFEGIKILEQNPSHDRNYVPTRRMKKNKYKK